MKKEFLEFHEDSAESQDTKKRHRIVLHVGQQENRRGIPSYAGCPVQLMKGSVDTAKEAVAAMKGDITQ